MTFDNQKRTLALLGIELTQENKEIYRKLFEEILKQRRALIGEPNATETLGEYVKRRNGVPESVEIMSES